MRTLISRVSEGRYRIHYGRAEIEADAAFIAKLLIEEIEDTLKDAGETCAAFELGGNMQARELTNVVYELDCMRDAKVRLQQAYLAKLPNRELREAYDRWVTAAYTLRLAPLYEALGLTQEEELDKIAA